MPSIKFSGPGTAFLDLKIYQKTTIKHAVLVFLSNIRTYMQGNQTNYWFKYTPPSIEDHLQLNFANTTENSITNSKSDENFDKSTGNEDS